MSWYRVLLRKDAERHAIVAVLASSETWAVELARKEYGSHLEVASLGEITSGFLQVGGNIFAIPQR